MGTRSCALPTWDFLAGICLLDLLPEHWRDLGHLIHGSHMDSVLIPLDFPCIVPIPDIHYNRIRMELGLTYGICFCNMSLAVIYWLIIP